MSRHPELEAILQARYDLEYADPSQKAQRRAKLEELIDSVLLKSGARAFSRRAFIEITATPYQQFKLAKKREERARLSRLR